MKICLVEPFFTGSHRRWATDFARRSRHQVDIISLPGRHWKWRMYGAAITLAKQYAALEQEYDAILVSDMLDVSVFLARLRTHVSGIPVALYFHENQLLYPWSPRDGEKKKGRDLHYAFTNYSSALNADRLFFNSDYHKTAYLEALPEFLNRYPDFQNLETIEEISSKSETLWLGMDLLAFDRYRRPSQGSQSDRPLILWNHRWEYDKNPIGFFRIIYGLIDRGLDFDLALLGDRFDEEPPYFKEAKVRLGDRIAQYGNVTQFSEYADWVWRADISLVTSNQDFFGGSVVEAIYCGCHPVLPNRLAYPDHLNPEKWSSLYYSSESEAIDKLATLITNGDWRAPFKAKNEMLRYDWTNQIDRYDSKFEELAGE